MQVIGRDRAIMRWLAHRGGARHHHQWKAHGADMPVAVAIGADPATILSAVLPLPETLSEFRFAGLIRGERLRLSPCITVPLMAPSDAEIVIEGLVSPDENRAGGTVWRPHWLLQRNRGFSGDAGHRHHDASQSGLSVDIHRPPTRRALAHWRSTQRAVRAPGQKAAAGNRRPMAATEACSYRIAIASIDKRYPGQARRIMLALWSLLPQLTYTKFLIVVDTDINVRDWADVAWAISTRSDPSRDLVTLTDTPIDYLDFASPKPGLGGKLEIDATRKTGAETAREWGRVLEMDAAVVGRVDELWQRLGLAQTLSQGPAR